LQSDLPVASKTGVTTRVTVDLDADNDPDIETTTIAKNVPTTDNTVTDPTDVESDPSEPGTSPLEKTTPEPAPVTKSGPIGIFEKGACPLSSSTPLRIFDVTAILARDILPVEAVTNQRTLVYNPRNTTVSKLDPDSTDAPQAGPLHDPTAIMFVRTRDLEPDP